MSINMASSSPSGKSQFSDPNRTLQMFYSKVAQIIVQSRTAFTTPPSQQPNTWFNYILRDIECVKRVVRAEWKDQWNQHIYTPMNVEIFLDMSEVKGIVGRGTSIRVGGEIFNSNYFSECTRANSQANQHTEQSSTLPPSIHRKRNVIVLEQWKVALERPSAAAAATISEKSVPDGNELYLSLILLVRSLALLVHILPAYKFKKSAVNKFLKLKLYYRITKVPLDPSHFDGGKHCETDEISFHPLRTALGNLSLSTVFRKKIDIELLESDKLVSEQLVEDYFDVRTGAKVGSENVNVVLGNGEHPSKIGVNRKSGPRTIITSPSDLRDKDMGNSPVQGVVLYPKNSYDSNGSSTAREDLASDIGSYENQNRSEAIPIQRREREASSSSEGIPIPGQSNSGYENFLALLPDKTPPFSNMKEGQYKTDFPDIPAPIAATPPLGDLNFPPGAISPLGSRRSSASTKDTIGVWGTRGPISPFKQVNSGDSYGSPGKESRRYSMLSNRSDRSSLERNHFIEMNEVGIFFTVLSCCIFPAEMFLNQINDYFFYQLNNDRVYMTN